MWGPEDEDQGIVPDYLYRAGARSRGGNIVLAESPFLAAGDIVEVGLAAPNIFPGGTGVLSAVGIEPVPEQEAWQGVLSLFSGAPIEAVKTTVEGATGRDSFTGGPLRNDAAGKFFRWADATVPAITRIAQRGEQFGFWEAGLVKEDQEGEIAARLLSMVTGVQHTLNNEGFQDRQLDYMRRDFEELLEQAMELDPTIPTVEEMREAGRLQEANRVLGAMLYAQPEEGETFEQAQIRRLRDLLPRAVAEQFGIPKDEITSEQTLADYINKAGEVRQLLNALGVEPTDEDVALLVANLPGGPSNALLEQLGIQGNQDNLFGRVTESPLERAAREQRELDEATAQLNAFSEIYGLSPERIAEIRPWLAEAERIVADARAFGLPQDELNAYLVSELLSRQDRMWIGIHGIEDLAKYERYEDAERDAEQAWNDLLNLSVVNRELGLGMSYEEIQILMYWSQLSGAEQDALGIPRQPSLPGREDLRSEQEIAEDILAEFFAVEQGRSRFEALAGN